jgi:hypothetical protein
MRPSLSPAMRTNKDTATSAATIPAPLLRVSVYRVNQALARAAVCGLLWCPTAPLDHSREVKAVRCSVVVQMMVLCVFIINPTRAEGLPQTDQAAQNTVQSSASHRPGFAAFDVATIKPTAPDWTGGRYIRMEGAHQLVVKNHVLRTLIAAAYNLNPQTGVYGGLPWMDSDHFDIVAETPGDTPPTYDEQMAMLQKLLADRFDLKFHRQQKQLPVYALRLAKNGSKLKTSTASP